MCTWAGKGPGIFLSVCIFLIFLASCRTKTGRMVKAIDEFYAATQQNNISVCPSCYNSESY